MAYKLSGAFRRTNIILKPHQYEWLREKAYKENSNISKILRELINEKMPVTTV